MNYFVVMIGYGRKQEAVVDPEITRREVVSRIRSREYKNISFIHHVTLDGATEDVTDEIMAEVHELECLPPLSPADLQAARFDHAQDHRKHEVA
jgi:hypothetical protein